jgi:hypothetical protein
LIDFACERLGAGVLQGCGPGQPSGGGIRILFDLISEQKQHTELVLCFGVAALGLECQITRACSMLRHSASISIGRPYLSLVSILTSSTQPVNVNFGSTGLAETRTIGFPNRALL